MKITRLLAVLTAFLLSGIAPPSAQAQWDYNYLTPNYNNFTYYRGYGSSKKKKRSRVSTRSKKRSATRSRKKRSSTRKLSKTTRRPTTRRSDR